MSIAQVVFDLPVPGHFDYAIPDALKDKVKAGMRVAVMLGTKAMDAFVIGINPQAEVATVKPIKKVRDAEPVFNGRDLKFARCFADYYGVTLGEALAVMVRHRKRPVPPAAAAKAFQTTLYHCPDGNYVPVLQKLTAGRSDHFLCVPDAAVANGLSIPKEQRAHVGLRSSIFEAFARCRFIIIVDDDNPSFKEEKSPMYQVRQAALMAQAFYGFDLAFVGMTPSVELMHLARTGKIAYHPMPAAPRSKTMVIDLGNYKFLDKGILSPPVRNRLQKNIDTRERSLILLNRRGTYSVTRCSDCGHILRCVRCNSPMVRTKKAFTCSHCTCEANEAGPCPSCRKNNWKSFGMGVEKVQKELAVLFPQAKVVSFERGETLPQNFDVLIATRAILAFKAKLSFHTTVLADIDAELNRLDTQSSFKGWSLAQQVRTMSKEVMVQSRNIAHHALKALDKDDVTYFYDEELRLRKELDFSPFSHWVAVLVRARQEKNALACAQDVYNTVNKFKGAGMSLSEPQADALSKVRDQYRFKIAVGGPSVEKTVVLIKDALSQLKRKGVIVTLDIDP